MTTVALQPILLEFTPVYKDYIWGGTRLPARLGRTAPRLDRYAESWELADHPDGMSVVRDGPYREQSLRRLVRHYAPSLIGQPAPFFPLLVKLIDTAERLSLQVHPDDETAPHLDGQPKTECWYVLDAAPGAVCWVGFKPGVTYAAFRAALAARAAADCLRPVPVKAGDLLHVPAGRVHAIGPGCFLLEVQQNSNTTYRLYDWDRANPAGGRRDLHLEKGLQAIRWNDTAPVQAPAGPVHRSGANTVRQRLAGPYFTIEEIALHEPLAVRRERSGFHIFFTASGGVRVRAAEFERFLPAGVTALLPAAVRDYTLAPRGESARLLRISQPASF